MSHLLTVVNDLSSERDRASTQLLIDTIRSDIAAAPIPSYPDSKGSTRRTEVAHAVSGTSKLPANVEYVSRGKVKFTNGVIVRACATCHKRRSMSACRLEYGHRENNWDDQPSLTRKVTRPLTLTDAEVGALVELALNERTEAESLLSGSPISRKRTRDQNHSQLSLDRDHFVGDEGTLSGRRSRRLVQYPNDDEYTAGRDEIADLPRDDSGSEYGKSEGTSQLRQVKGLSDLGELMLHALMQNPETNCYLPTEEGKEAQIQSVRDQERKKQLIQWSTMLAEERAILEQICNQTIVGHELFATADDNINKSKSFMNATEYQRLRKSLVPPFVEYIEAAAASSRPLQETLVETEVHRIY